MTIDRRTFTTQLMIGAGAGIAGFPVIGAEARPVPRSTATVLLDPVSGRILHRSGPCTMRLTPCSSFKIPLALIGYDAGILQDAHNPAWDYRPAVNVAHRPEEKQRTDPTSWELNSVVWYSQQLTSRLGMARFQAYVDRIAYGNRDLSGNPGKRDGLTQAWLGASLKISPDEQVAFLRRLLAHRLLSAAACAKTEAIIPAFQGSGGWQVRGKTGSGVLNDAAGRPDPERRLGWFVGWADKGTRRVIFARAGIGSNLPSASGRAVRDALLAEIGRLAG